VDSPFVLLQTMLEAGHPNFSKALAIYQTSWRHIDKWVGQSVSKNRVKITYYGKSA
jgi:hypothetical protein